VETNYDRKAYYIPNGVLPSSYLEPDKINEKWGLKKGDYILNVSRLVRHKGTHYLIRAFKELETEKKLVLVGEGAHTDSYVRQLKQEAEGDSRIIFTGVQFNSVLKEIYSNAFLFVQPSEAEGLSIALLEAMSYGLPVLASDIRENREALGKNGVFFENKNHQDLALKIKGLLSDSEFIAATGRDNKERALQKYGWDNIVTETLKVYSD